MRFASPPYPVASGPKNETFHRHHYAMGWQVLTLEGWHSERSANYASTVPITKIPHCDPVLKLNTGLQFNEATRTADSDVMAELQEIRTKLALQSESQLATIVTSFRTDTPAAAPVVETLAQQSARLERFVEMHNESVEKSRGQKAHDYLQTHLRPVGPWVAEHMFPDSYQHPAQE